MNNIKKIIFLSLIPVILTIFFIVKFTVPSVSEFFDLKKQIKAENTAIKETKNNIENLKANKALSDSLDKLNIKLASFDVEFPNKFKDEILLIDMEMFADETINRIVGLQSSTAKQVKIETPEKKASKKSKKRRRSKTKEEVQPVTILEKPIEITTVAYYNEVIDFVTFIEDYQRKININSINTTVFSDDKALSNPRVELKINGNIYKAIENKLPEKAAPVEAEKTTRS